MPKKKRRRELALATTLLFSSFALGAEAATTYLQATFEAAQENTGSGSLADECAAPG